MTQVLQELIQLLNLEAKDANSFIGQSQDLGFRNVFGGQVLGQALAAATRTVSGRSVHSLHGYFLRPGDAKETIRYEVDRIRDGKSFSTRRVVAMQFGRPIFNMSCSFQIHEPGHSHQIPKPEVKDPDGLTSDLEFARKYKDRIPERVREKFTCDRPIEIRTIGPQNPFNPKKREALKHSWVRTSGNLPEDQNIHKCLLAYASDFGLLSSSLMPHGLSWINPNLHMASLDHAMWFHRDFKFDDWLLYEVDSPSSSGGRGFTRGRVFNRAGDLVASVSQEGLIRDRSLKEDVEA